MQVVLVSLVGDSSGIIGIAVDCLFDSSPVQHVISVSTEEAIFGLI